MPESQGKPRGRPRVAETKSAGVVIKFTEKERQQLHATAKALEKSLSEYCRESLLATMNGPRPESVESRLSRLEQSVKELQQRADYQDTSDMEASERE